MLPKDIMQVSQNEFSLLTVTEVSFVEEADTGHCFEADLSYTHRLEPG